MLCTYTHLDATQIAGRYRPPDWRNDSAQRLIEEGRVPSLRIHDDVTIELYDFCHRRQQCDTEHDLAALYQGASHVSEAVQMYELGCHGPCCVLESLVLADEDPDRIATRMTTTAEVVKFYEDAFWDIRSRLSDHDFIVNHCIGLRNAGADREKFACAAMKFVAYMTGSESINLFAFPAGAPNRWQSVGGLVSQIDRRARLLLRVDALQDGRFADPRAKRDLLRVMDSLQQWSDNYGDECSPQTKDERAVARLLDAINGRAPWESVSTTE